MQGNRARDTSPELRLRSLLHSVGLRYRVGYAALPGSRRSIDVAFTRSRVAVFIDGCFWHGCPRHFGQPATNSDYWKSKIARNRSRDADTDRRLAELGWTVVRVWEHESPSEAVARIRTALQGRPRETLRR